MWRNTCTLQDLFKLLIFPWSADYNFEVTWEGNRQFFIDLILYLFSCEIQFSISKRIVLLFLFISAWKSHMHSSYKSDVIQAFRFALYEIGKFLHPLKHRGFLDLPIHINFFPFTLDVTKAVSITFDRLPPVQFSPFRTNIFSGNFW